MGAFACIFMLFWISGPLLAGAAAIAARNWFGTILILFGSVGIIGLYFAVQVLGAGWAIIRNNTYGQIEIDDDHLIAREYFGRFSKRTVRLVIDDIQRIEIVPLEQLGKGSERGEESEANLGVLFPPGTGGMRAVIRSSHKPKAVVVAYPQELLTALSPLLQEELARVAIRMGRRLEFDGIVNRWKTFEAGVGDDAMVAGQSLPEPRVAPDRPVDCRIDVIRARGQPLVFRLPSHGLTGHARHLFIFSCFWNGILLLLGFGFIAGMIADPPGLSTMAFVGLILAVFLAIGIGTLLLSLNMARRSFLVGIDDNQLFCESKGLYGTDWTELARDQIGAIVVGNSGMSINEVPLRQIQIVPKSGNAKQLSLFTGLPDDELDWLCFELNRELGLVEAVSQTSMDEPDDE
jgi:hypothetical protein